MIFFSHFFLISTVTFGGGVLSYSARLLSKSAAALMEGSHMLFLSEPDTSSWQQNTDLSCVEFSFVVGYLWP